jgi:hypothetical protein
VGEQAQGPAGHLAGAKELEGAVLPHPEEEAVVAWDLEALTRTKKPVKGLPGGGS